MAIEWLAGNRLKGTTAERPEFGLPSGSVGGWKLLGRTTFGGGAKTYEVANLANKRYLMVLVNNFQSAQVEGDSLRFNDDTTANLHSGRYNNNGGTDGLIVNKTKTNCFGFHPHSQPSFAVLNVASLSDKQKLGIIHSVGHSSNVSGSANAPDRAEMVAKYSNTSDPISSIQQVNVWANYDSGSEMVVLGWDPSDTHTDNFWEELASVTTSSASDTVDTGSFSQKKYLWIQIYNPAKPTGSNTYAYFNNITTGGTHSGRSNTNGVNPSTGSAGSDYQLTGSNGSILNHDPSDPDSGTTPMFTNMFVINNADKEKLSIVHSVSGWSSTTGAGQVPARYECVGKWAKTDQAITSVQCGGLGTNGMGSGSIIKVWGAN